MIQAMYSLKRNYITFLLFLSLFGLSACDNKIDDWFDELGDNNNESVVCEELSPSDFKKIAYWSVSDEDTLENIDFAMLTHIIYNKIGVDYNGNLSLPTGGELDEFEEMIETAQQNCVITMVSIGNDSDTAFKTITANKDILNNFRDNLEELINEYDLDGIDINWQFPEGSEEGDLFEDLIKEMDDLSHDENILLSYVVDTGQYSDTDNGVQDDTLVYGDFLNVMALDTTDNDDLHSSFDDAENAIKYWVNREVDKSRLILAIPVYSQGDGKLSFSDVVDDDRSNACVDEASHVKSSTEKFYDDINYNGIPTVIEKTEYAKNNANGVILTSLEQDYLSFSSYSLLLTVDWQVADLTNSICNE